jgi:hypothetical protein
MTRLFFILSVLMAGVVGAQTPNSTTDFSQKINGRFALKGADCAGFELIGNKKIIWRNEISCLSPDTFAVFWLDQKTFVTKDINKESVNKDCPPRNWIYKVLAYDGEKLILEEVWTGWGEYKTDNLEFIRWIHE